MALAGASSAVGSSGRANAVALYVSPSGSPTSNCSQSSPCANLDRAYHLAQPGQQVQILAGTYPSQLVRVDTSKTSQSNVVFQGVGSVSLSGLRILASHLEIRSVTTNGWSVETPAADVTLRNVTSTSAIFITGASDVSVLGGSAGPPQGTYLSNGSQIKATSGSTVPPKRILIDGVVFHDFRKAPGSADHVDCLHILSGDGITVRDSRFANCEAFAILFTVLGTAGPPTNVLVENNFLECCASGFYSLSLGGGHGEVFTNFLIRNNSTDKPMTTSTANTLHNVVFRNNIAPSIAGCRRADSDYNVLYASGTCGPHDIRAPSGFADPATGDFHLVRGAAAIGRADQKQQPVSDIDGQRRPTRVSADIGADQREPATMALGRSIGMVSVGMSEAAVTAFYGLPLKTTHQRVANTERVVTIATYRAHPGTLKVTYSGSAVVGISTSSRFYATTTGLGVSAKMPALAAHLWSPCRKAYRRYMSKVAVYLKPAGGRHGKSLGSVTMLRRGYGDC